MSLGPFSPSSPPAADPPSFAARLSFSRFRLASVFFTPATSSDAISVYFPDTYSPTAAATCLADSGVKFFRLALSSKNCRSGATAPGTKWLCRVGSGLFVILNVAVIPFICFSVSTHRSPMVRISAPLTSAAAPTPSSFTPSSTHSFAVAAAGSPNTARSLSHIPGMKTRTIFSESISQSPRIVPRSSAVAWHPQLCSGTTSRGFRSGSFGKGGRSVAAGGSVPTASAPILTHEPYRDTICAARRTNLSAAWTHTTPSLHERSSAFQAAPVAANANPPWPSTARTSEWSSR